MFFDYQPEGCLSVLTVVLMAFSEPPSIICMKNIKLVKIFFYLFSQVYLSRNVFALLYNTGKYKLLSENVKFYINMFEVADI